MGRNSPSSRMEIEQIASEIRKFYRLIPLEDRELIEDLISRAKEMAYLGSVTNLDPYFLFLLSVIISIKKEKQFL
ncbi:MAG: hypothetical protein RXN92_01400 [Thermoplasmatales archaeon]|jgi:uncharacterized membrane protein